MRNLRLSDWLNKPIYNPSKQDGDCKPSNKNTISLLHIKHVQHSALVEWAGRMKEAGVDCLDVNSNGEPLFVSIDMVYKEIARRMHARP